MHYLYFVTTSYLLSFKLRYEN